jgi:tetratricopeptide (TPR) repeat protein
MEQAEKIMRGSFSAREQNVGGAYFVRCSGPTALEHAAATMRAISEFEGPIVWHEIDCGELETMRDVFRIAEEQTTSQNDMHLVTNMPLFPTDYTAGPFYEGVDDLASEISQPGKGRMVLLIHESSVPRLVKYLPSIWAQKGQYVAWPVAKQDREAAQSAEELKKVARSRARADQLPNMPGGGVDVEAAKNSMRKALGWSTEGQLEEARKAAIKAARVFKEHGEGREMALAYELLGTLAERRGDVTEARAWLRAAVDTWRNAHDANKTAECFAKLGHLSYLCGDRDKAARQFQSALEIDDELGNHKKVSAGLRRLGMIAEEQGEFARAAEMYRESAEVVEKADDDLGLSRAYHHLGRLHERSGDFQEALKWHNMSRELKESINDRVGLATTFHHLGNVHLLMAHHDDAGVYYEKAIALEDEFKDYFGKAASLKQLGEVAMAQREWHDALRCFLFAYEIWTVFESPMSRSVLGHLGQLRGMVDEEEIEELEKEAAEAAQVALREGDRALTS